MRRKDRTPQIARFVTVVLLAAVYVLFVGTARGREIDTVLVLRNPEIDDRHWEIVVAMLSWLLSPIPICLALVGLLWLARRRGRRSDGIRAVVMVVGAALAARALKALLGSADPTGAEAARELGAAFYPSGHAAVAMALCLAVMVIAREHRRSLVLAGGVWCSVHGILIFAAPTHHVSDIIGGFLLGVAVASVIGLRGSHDPARARSVWAAVLAILTAAISAALLMELARRVDASSVQPAAVRLVTAAGLSTAAFLLVAGFARMLHGTARR